MNAVLGDLISTKARHRRIGGFVVDGLIRDLPAILALGDFPVFARGVTPIGPLHRGPGEINMPICCGGIVVHPGDIIMGDLNGTVVIPLHRAEELLERLRGQAATEAEYTAAVARGDFSNAWVDRFLRQSGLDPDQAETDDGCHLWIARHRRRVYLLGGLENALSVTRSLSRRGVEVHASGEPGQPGAVLAALPLVPRFADGDLDSALEWLARSQATRGAGVSL